MVELLFPSQCAGCGVEVHAGQAFCATCADSVEPLVGPACPVCGIPEAGWPQAGQAGSSASGRCARCLSAAPAFARLRSSFLYGGQLATAIQRLKFGRRPEVARPLGRLLLPLLNAAVEEAVRETRASPLLVPVPLHPRRLRSREFNQALLLIREARRAARAQGQPVPPPPDPLALRRIRDTPPQTACGARERPRNVAGAFAASGRRVAGRAVLLIDDVATTGATADACARAILRAGALRVEVLTLARAVP